jgi:hypothetical protein
MARAVLKCRIMKMQTSTGKRCVQRGASQKAARIETMNLPRLFLFLEVFVEKDIPLSSK